MILRFRKLTRNINILWYLQVFAGHVTQMYRILAPSGVVFPAGTPFGSVILTSMCAEHPGMGNANISSGFGVAPLNGEILPFDRKKADRLSSAFRSHNTERSTDWNSFKIERSHVKTR